MPLVLFGQPAPQRLQAPGDAHLMAAALAAEAGLPGGDDADEVRSAQSRVCCRPGWTRAAARSSSATRASMVWANSRRACSCRVTSAR
ncbi:hypothetical protein [Nonomuraea sp. NPDC005650]|uniref:hypothetical protein n=1 Tax=Nonomuraea sp. NPDC005650 TaxID=3157045 RepID=UPI0033A0D61B